MEVSDETSSSGALSGLSRSSGQGQGADPASDVSCLRRGCVENPRAVGGELAACLIGHK